MSCRRQPQRNRLAQGDAFPVPEIPRMGDTPLAGRMLPVRLADAGAGVQDWWTLMMEVEALSSSLKRDGAVRLWMWRFPDGLGVTSGQSQI